jgi:hypothetical protein
MLVLDAKREAFEKLSAEIAGLQREAEAIGDDMFAFLLMYAREEAMRSLETAQVRQSN